MDLMLDGQGPLYVQLARALKEAIATGRVASGSRVPPSRDLARALGLSRTTVVAAFEHLRAEGLLSARVGAGSFVSVPPAAAPAAPPQPPREVPPPSRFSQRLREAYQPELLPRRHLQGLKCAFDCSRPMVDPALHAAWLRALARAAPYVSPGYPPPRGLPALREAVCAHVTRTRGLRCTPDDILIVGGTQQALSLIARVLLDPGEEAVIEEPAYLGTRKILQIHGALVTGVPVDGEGLCTERLPRRPVKAVFVTPSHQFPTGAVLSAARRRALLDYARRHDGWIVEDDYDGEFRQDAPPVPALQSIDPDGRVIYVGSFSKTLFPALRLGYVVMPRGLQVDFLTAKWADDLATAPLEQAALARLIESGAYARHLLSVSRRLAERRRSLRDALARYCGERVTAFPSHAGMHLMVRVEDMPADRGPALLALARKRSLGLFPAADCYLAPPPRLELLMGYAALPVPQLREAVRVFAFCLDALS